LLLLVLSKTELVVEVWHNTGMILGGGAVVLASLNPNFGGHVPLFFPWLTPTI